MQVSQASLKLSLSCFLLSVCSSIFANNTAIPTTQQTIMQAQAMQNSVEVATNLTPIQQDKWSEWGLTQTEWTKYESLMKGSRGIWSPNLDPLTVLGVEANSDAERERYAELLARKEKVRVEKELAFQVTYSRVFERLYPNLLPFRVDEQGSVSTNPISAVNRVIYFTRTDCGKKCKDNLDRLLVFAKNTPIDIYVVDSLQDDQKIRQWAMDNHIDVGKVKSRQITLNHDKGFWLKYAKGKMPVAFQIQENGEWAALAY